MQFHLLAVLPFVAGSPDVPSFGGQFVARGDYLMPRESARVELTIANDVDAGMSMVNYSTPDGFNTQLCRQDLGLGFWSWAHADGNVCVSFNITSSCEVLQSFDEFFLGEIEFWRDTRIAGVPAVQFGSMASALVFPNETVDELIEDRYAQNIEVSWTFDATTGTPLHFNNAGEDGIFDFEQWAIFQFDDAVPDATLFDVPSGCVTTTQISEPTAHRPRRRATLGRLRSPAAPVRPPLLDLPIHRSSRSNVEASWTFIDNSRYASPVRDQGVCGACWAFSSLAVAEIVLAKADALPARWLSPQFLLDCASPNFDSTGFPLVRGCFGSSLLAEGAAIMLATGVPLDVEYRFQATTTPECPLLGERNLTMIFPLESAEAIAGGLNTTVWEMMLAVAVHGAITATLNPALLDFYSGGVFDEPGVCTPSVGHQVAIVGFGTDDGAGDYWLCKNSYGPAWGESGYFRIARGVNMCGIEDYPIAYIARKAAAGIS